MNSKKILVVLLAVMLVVSCTALVACQGSTEPTGELQYALTEDGSSYVVVASAVGGDIVVPDSYNDLPVVGISDLAFSKSDVTSVVIPDTITYIGDSAFWQCGSLLTVAIGNSVATIGQYAFMDCTKLNTLTLGSSITSIGQLAFYGCDNLSKVYVVGGLDSWLSIDFANISANPMYYTDNVYLDTTATNKLCDITNVVVPSSTTDIYSYAFYNCNSITTVALSDSVLSIGDSAFADITTLASIDMGNGVVHIGQSAFYNCTSLTSIMIPNSVVTVGDNAFMYCTSLSIVTMGDSVQTIGEYAFCSCTSLDDVSFGASVTTIGDFAFEYNYSLANIYYNGTVADWCNIQFVGLKRSNPMYTCAIWHTLDSNGEFEVIVDLVIPDGVAAINSSAFYSCKQLTSLTISKSVIDIDKYAFMYCASLSGATLGDSVQTIGEYAFNSCTSLDVVEFGASVTAIANGAFSNCADYLSNIYYNGTVSDWCDIQFASSTSNPMHTGAIWYSLDSSDNYQAVCDLVIPDEVTAISPYAFYNYCQLTSVTISDTVTSIGNYAFSYSDNIEFVTFGDSVASIGSYAFTDCDSIIDIEFPNSLRSVGYYCFYACKSLSTVQLGEGIQDIASLSFAWNNISSIYIPASVISIGDGMLDDCGNLQFIEVDADNMYYCSDLGSLYTKDMTVLCQYPMGSSATTYTMPSEVTSIYSRALRNSVALTEVLVDQYNTSYCSYEGVLYDIDMTTLVFYPPAKSDTELIVPDGVTTIDKWACMDADNLVSVMFADSVTDILHSSFTNCHNLSNVEFGAGLLKIDDYVFLNCHALVELTVPASVTYIGYYAVRNCSELVSVQFEDTSNWYVVQLGDSSTAAPVDVSSAIANAVALTSDEYVTYTCYMYKVVE